jgi:uncharacterized protein YmfQ (DUF2313 family)
MAVVSSITFQSQFGSSGSLDGQFRYPTGITVKDSEIFICDRQNHRIQVFDLSGVFLRKFGTVGSGQDQFFFPDGVTNDGTHIYIVDSGNHRIKKVLPNGTFVLEFGSIGSGNDNFNYPVGIKYINSNLHIADKQNNRIKIHDTSGAFVSEITGFNLPEDVSLISGLLAISDSGNKEIKTYAGLVQVADSSFEYVYPTFSEESEGLLITSDTQGNRLVFLDQDLNTVDTFGSVGSGQDQFFFPAGLYYDDTMLIVVDSANHRIKIFELIIVEDVPVYSGVIRRLTKTLYPEGRAWWQNKEGIFNKFHEALSYSEARAYENARNILQSILPDNSTFNEIDATNWERALGIIINTSLDLETRKTAILRKMKFPGSIKARQSAEYLQDQLQLAGFDVYVFNANGVQTTAFYGTFNYGELKYGQDGFGGTTIANYIDESKDAAFDFGIDINLRATFFIGASVLGNFANVPANRKDEFRELILKIKPAQTAGSLLVNYI